MTPRATTAVRRFGLGARPGELDAAARDPVRWLRKQLAPAPTPAALGDLRSAEAIAGGIVASRGMGKEVRRAMRADGRATMSNEARARLTVAAHTDRPFVERLVHFWSNHFTVSAARPEAVSVVGAFEREAIRPHVLGRFADMLVAAEQHQAMQVYLDNVASIGPDSRAGRRSGRGLNENLAREILELHTLGVNGGYAQADVVALAKLLTGWTLGGRRDARPGAVRFVERRHQPGPKVLLGRRYDQGGREEGVAALRDLAAEPATARYVAERFARHFVADEPPGPLVAALEDSFLTTRGDLRALAETLIDHPAAWGGAGKVQTPWELVVAAARALPELADRTVLWTSTLKRLGQPTWSAPSPAGWPDRAEDWVGPEAVVRRVEFARRVARRVGEVDALARLDAALGAAGASLRPVVARAPKADRLALLLASPQFQRR